MVLAAFKLDDLVIPLEVVEANGALSRFFEEDVTEWEVFQIPDNFPVNLPTLGDH